MQQGMLGALPTSMSATSLGVKLLSLVNLFHGRGSTGLCGTVGSGVCGSYAACCVNNLSWCLLPTMSCWGDVCSHGLLLSVGWVHIPRIIGDTTAGSK